MNSLDIQIQKILNEVTGLSGKETGDTLEIAVKESLKSLGVKMGPEGGNFSPFDFSIASPANVSGAFEVKQLKTTLAKLGSAKTKIVVNNPYMSSIVNLGRVVMSLKGKVKALDNWWFESAEGGNIPRADAFSRLEIGRILFSEITDSYTDVLRPKVNDLLTLLAGRTVVPNSVMTIDVTRGGKKIATADVPDAVYMTKIEPVISPQSSSVRGMDRILPILFDVLEEGDNSAKNWKKWKDDLASDSVKIGGVKGIFGVKGDGTKPDDIKFFRPDDLTTVAMTQGGRLILRPLSDGFSVESFVKLQLK